jgi:hypothetical protein
MNLAFSRIKGMEKFQDKLVKITVASGEARIASHPV